MAATRYCALLALLLIFSIISCVLSAPEANAAQPRRDKYVHLRQRISLDGTCGGSKGFVCPAGECCCEHGKCGKGLNFCGASCQKKYGTCYSTSTSSTRHKSTSSTQHKQTSSKASRPSSSSPKGASHSSNWSSIKSIGHSAVPTHSTNSKKPYSTRLSFVKPHSTKTTTLLSSSSAKLPKYSSSSKSLKKASTSSSANKKHSTISSISSLIYSYTSSSSSSSTSTTTSSSTTSTASSSTSSRTSWTSTTTPSWTSTTTSSWTSTTTSSSTSTSTSASTSNSTLAETTPTTSSSQSTTTTSQSLSSSDVAPSNSTSSSTPSITYTQLPTPSSCPPQYTIDGSFIPVDVNSSYASNITHPFTWYLTQNGNQTAKVQSINGANSSIIDFGDPSKLTIYTSDGSQTIFDANGITIRDSTCQTTVTFGNPDLLSRLAFALDPQNSNVRRSLFPRADSTFQVSFNIIDQCQNAVVMSPTLFIGGETCKLVDDGGGDYFGQACVFHDNSDQAHSCQNEWHDTNAAFNGFLKPSDNVASEQLDAAVATALTTAGILLVPLFPVLAMPLIYAEVAYLGFRFIQNEMALVGDTLADLTCAKVYSSTVEVRVTGDATHQIDATITTLSAPPTDTVLGSIHVDNNLTSDAKNCGACGNVCEEGICVDSKCGCPEGQVNCNGKCVDSASAAAAACDPAGNLLRNGDFEDDGDMVPFSNGLGWWLPEPPAGQDLDSWDGWQIETRTTPEATLLTSGCLSGDRCLQLYAIRSGTPITGYGAQAYQPMIRRFTAGAAYTFTYSYRVDFLNILSGSLDGTAQYCYLYSMFHESQGSGGTSMIRFSSEVEQGTGEWKTASFQFNYQDTDASATTDEFYLQCYCQTTTATVQFGVTVDNLIVVAA